MNDIVEKWCEKLESGEYKQGRGFLRNDKDEYCCLGVLCDIYDKEAWSLYENIYKYKCGREEMMGSLPKIIRNEANLSFIEEKILVNKNDSQWLDFKEIAQWIRENILKKDIEV